MTPPLPTHVPHAVVTRDEDPGTGRLGAALRARDVPVLHWPTTAILPPSDPSALEALAREAAGYDWVVFTSRNAVAAVAGAVGPAPPGLRVAVVGDKTGEAAREAGWAPDLTGDASGEALARELAGRLDGPRSDRVRVLFPTTPLAADTLPDVLAAAGHEVRRVEAYRTGYAALDPAACARAMEEGRVGVVTFTSPSAVEGLVRALPDDLLERLREAARAVTIGPTSSAAAREAGWAVREARETSLEGVAARAAELVEARRRGGR